MYKACKAFTIIPGPFTPVGGSGVVGAGSEGKEGDRKLWKPRNRGDALDYYALKICVN